MEYIVKFVLIMLVIIASVSCNDRSNMEDSTPVVEVDLFNSIEELPMSSFIDTLVSVRLELPSPLFLVLLQKFCLLIQIFMLLMKSKRKYSVLIVKGNF